jgi:hypothetical protein
MLAAWESSQEHPGELFESFQVQRVGSARIVYHDIRSAKLSYTFQIAGVEYLKEPADKRLV